MTWRQLPPVLSPITLRALADGVAATMGLRRNPSDLVESMVRARYGASAALLTDSGTSALVLALRKMLPRGGTVAYPAYACIDLTSAALASGVRVRLYDLDPETLSPDLDSVRDAIGRGVDAIVVAHLYGYPADMPGIIELAEEAGIPVIEDAAQSAGGSFRGAPLGSFADVSVLSFGRGKGITAGSGGALLARTVASAEWLRSARAELPKGTRGATTMASLTAQLVLSNSALYRVPASIPALRLGEMVFHPARDVRAMSPGSCAVLRRTLGLADRDYVERRKRARDLLTLMRGNRTIQPARSVSGGEPGFLRFAFLDCTGERAVREDLGAVRGYPMTLDQHPQLRSLLLPGEQAGTGSRILRDRLFTVPTHTGVNRSDVLRIAEWLSEPTAESSALIPLS